MLVQRTKKRFQKILKKALSSQRGRKIRIKTKDRRARFRRINPYWWTWTLVYLLMPIQKSEYSAYKHNNIIASVGDNPGAFIWFDAAVYFIFFVGFSFWF